MSQKEDKQGLVFIWTGGVGDSGRTGNIFQVGSVEVLMEWVIACFPVDFESSLMCVR